MSRGSILLSLSIAGLLSCSTPSLEEHYKGLSPVGQAGFLARYPELRKKPEDQQAAIDKESKFVYGENPKNYTLTGLDVIASFPNPVLQGKSLDLSATLRYADGRTADATPDVRWTVFPQLAWIQEGKLRFECVSSDVVVAANFLDERQGAATIQFRKPLSRLELTLDDSSRNFNVDRNLALELKAQCQDGTASFVTCQAEWKSLTPGVEISGCGHVYFAKKIRGKFSVRAHYGNLTIDRTLQTR